MSHFYDEITTALPELQVLKDEPMSRHTTFRIGGPADYFVCPDREQIAEVLAVAKKCGMAITVIGNGSNLLVGDKGIRGLVVEIGSAMNQIMVDKNHITAGAGALLSQVAAKAAAAELGGMEFAAGIPGSVGGAVTMNAGAYGGEMKDILRTVTVLTPEGEYWKRKSNLATSRRKKSAHRWKNSETSVSRNNRSNIQVPEVPLSARRDILQEN